MAGAVSAEEELFQLACQDMPVTSDEVREAMDAWAHELAEQIRAEAGRPPAYCTAASRLTYRWHARRNADVIDPEKP